MREFNRGAYQYRRLRRFYDCASSPRHVSSPTPGYADLRGLTRIIDVASTEESITVRHVLPRSLWAPGEEQAPAAKIVAPHRATTRALRQLVQARLA